MSFMAATAIAQTVNLHKTDGTVVCVPTSELDYIDFTAKENVRHISVEVALADDDATRVRRVGAKAPIITTSTFDEFYLRGVYNNVLAEYKATKNLDTKIWTLTPNTWPDDYSGEISFYAYNNDKGDDIFVEDGANSYIHYAIAENASTQLDLLVAKATVTAGSGNIKVPLTFDHACAAIAFNLSMTETLASNLGVGKTLTVNSIVLRNIKNDGKYYFNTGAWDQESMKGSAYYTLTSGDIVVSTTPQALLSNDVSSNYIFMIPQSCAANGTDGVYLDVNYTVTGKEQQNAKIPASVNWLKGNKYTINISLGTKYIVI